MRYIDIGGWVIPKHCIYGPRPAEGIVFNSYEWWSITDHLVKEQREREMAAVCKAKEEAKKNLSFEMTSNWSNTLASIKTQSNQKRLEKMEKEKQDKIDQYHQIIKSRMEEKKEILAKVKKIIFQEKDAVKTINSAVWFSTVLDDRKKQIEFNNSLREDEAELNRELLRKFKKEAEDYEREKYQEKLNERAKNNILKQHWDAQMAEIRKKKQEEAEEFKRQQEDLKNITAEGERIHHCNMAEKEYRKQFAARFIRKTESQLELERKYALEQEEEDEINKIYVEYGRKFKRERREREERIKNEEVERRTKISEMLAQQLAEKVLKQEENILSAIKEKEEQAKREEEEKKEKERQALEILLEGKRKADEERARKEYENKEREKWELIQQYRSAEINEEWRELEKKREKEKREKVIAGLNCQCKQIQEKRARDLKEWLAPLEDESAEKEELLRYCDETMKFIRDHNLPEHPVRAAFDKMKKLYGIEDAEQQELEKKRKQKEAEQQENRKSRPLGNGCYCFKY